MKNLALIIAAVFILGACSNTSNNKPDKKTDDGKKVTLTAAGATFPMP